MVLSPCRDCHNPVATSAKICPLCGSDYPSGPPVSDGRRFAAAGPRRMRRIMRRMMRRMLWMMGFMIAVAVLIIMIRSW